MQRKLTGYFLLSFLSFCFFICVFLVFANTQAKANQSIQTEEALPIVRPNQQEDKISIQEPVKNTLQTASPTPTIFMTQNGQQTNAPTPTTQATATPTPSPTLQPIATPTMQPTPQPIASGNTDLETLFDQYSGAYNISKDQLKKIAQCESGFNPNADSGTYAGMFQFSATTWASTRGQMGLDPNPDLRKNTEESIKTTAYMLSQGRETAWPNCH
jgi:soluble lytic murein transglycosylase-like protein